MRLWLNLNENWDLCENASVREDNLNPSPARVFETLHQNKESLSYIFISSLFLLRSFAVRKQETSTLKHLMGRY